MFEVLNNQFSPPPPFYFFAKPHLLLLFFLPLGRCLPHYSAEEEEEEEEGMQLRRRAERMEYGRRKGEEGGRLLIPRLNGPHAAWGRIERRRGRRRRGQTRMKMLLPPLSSSPWHALSFLSRHANFLPLSNGIGLTKEILNLGISNNSRNTDYNK